MTGAELAALCDGNWVNISTAAGGVIYALLNRLRVRGTRPFLSQATGLDVFNGMAFVPLLLVSLAPMSSAPVNAVEQQNPVILTGVAIWAMFALLQTP